MINLVKAFNKPTKAAIAAVLAVIASVNIANAQTVENPVLDIYDNGVPNTTRYNQPFVPSVPDGFDSDYDYTRTGGTGISIDARASYGYSYDFDSKYINTSGGETVTVMDAKLGLQGGISLGCDGLDLGLEALFQFDAGDILEYLPQYILTNLATEALAQIYATPLVSTVMDGLKAMQNFTAEFTQANCDMNKVMDRANEIKAANYQKCVEEIGDGERDGRTAHAYCSDPTGLQKSIEDAKNSFTNWAPMGESLDRVLSEAMGATGADYGGPAADYSDPHPYKTDADGNKIPDPDWGENQPQGRVPSKGRMLAMFIPNMKFTSSKDKSNAAVPPSSEMTPSEAYDRSKTTARNFIIDVYKDIKKSTRNKNLEGSDNEDLIISLFNQYKTLVVNEYGSRDVFTDNDSKRQRKPDSVSAIEDQFKEVSNLKYSTFRTDEGGDTFAIGPQDGPGSSIPSSETDFKSGAVKEMLELGNTCWVKVNMDEDGNYKWVKAHQNPDAVFNIKSTSMDDLTDNITQCVIADRVNFTLYHAYQKAYNNKALYSSYLNFLAQDAAYEATDLIVKAIDFQSDNAIATDVQKLTSYCMQKTNNGSNMNNVEKLAARDGRKNLPFEDCTEYADQMKLSEDKRLFLNAEKEKRAKQLETLKALRDKTEKEYKELIEIYGKSK
ncbi:MAG: hypothetical protein CFH44_00663 [Proteobacteria bacterium]|nr:MAG: hypothetical protein CFH44_00663 [Pseudomonadota bacterium]|tara:strand:- start:2297 stop:4297 length:2001 start_codon:yes stop_codon:yes gene_type:complete